MEGDKVQRTNLLIGVMIISVFVGGLGIVLLIEWLRPGKDNSLLQLGILGFISTNVAALLSRFSSEKNHDVLQDQNKVLKNIQDRLSKLEEKNV